MDPRYSEYAFADKFFYDKNTTSKNSGYRISRNTNWKNWNFQFSDEWTYCFSQKSGILPTQGWKVHVSSTLNNAQKILNIVSEYCNENNLNFKYLPNIYSLRNRNDKYANRGASGKFITIYPTDEENFEKILIDLDKKIGGEPGPYILSDVRYKAGPLYARYGGFAPRQFVNEEDKIVPCIEDPDGNLVEDRRLPIFHVPAWVSTPDIVEKSLQLLGSPEAPEELPYIIKSSIHFSNSGGVYIAEDKKSKSRIVVKQARPYTAYDIDNDAVDRLKNERDILNTLKECEYVPKLLDSRYIAEDYFIAETLCEGITLTRVLTSTTPILKEASSFSDKEEFCNKVIDIIDNVEKAIHDIHSRGIFIGDLHTGNIMVDDENKVKIIDLETATKLSNNSVSKLGVPGFSAPREITGVESDYYALGCLMLSAFLPITPIMQYSSNGLSSIVEEIIRLYPMLSMEYIHKALNLINGTPYFDDKENIFINSYKNKNIQEKCNNICTGVRRAVDVSRDDRIFPADPAVFWTDGFNYMHGASGIIDILDENLGEFKSLSLDWVENKMNMGGKHLSPGLLYGSLGAAIVLAKNGRTSCLQSLVREALETRDLSKIPSNLGNGLAGWAVSLPKIEQFISTREFKKLDNLILSELYLRGKRQLSEYRPNENNEYVWDKDRGGLYHGSLGIALALLTTNIDQNISLANKMLREESKYLERVESAGLQLREPSRVLPYIATGSAGFGVVIKYAQEANSDETFMKDIVDGIAESTKTEFVIQSGFSNGRAGLLAAISLFDPENSKEIERQQQGLDVFLHPYKDGILPSGDQLLKMSCDFSTGAAGIIHSLRYSTSNSIDKISKKSILEMILPVLR